MAISTTTDIVYISAEAIVGAITVVGNIIVLAAIFRTKRLHTITNIFISNLAIADIAVGVFVAPCAALSFLGVPHSVYGCIFINSAILMFTNVSILMLLTIAIERFLAIRFPFIYQRNMTNKVAIWVNISIWIIGSILGLMPMYGWNKAPDELPFCAFTKIITMEYMVYFQFFGLVVVPLLIMFCIYLYILFIVRQHMKTTRAMQNMFRDQQNGKNRSRFDKDVEAAKLFALLFFLFGIFWLPVNIMNCFTLFCPSCEAPYQLLLTTIVLSHANSSINPFLYAASNSRIKDAIKAMFGMKHSAENLANESVAFNANSKASNCNANKIMALENGLNGNSDLKSKTNYGGMGSDESQIGGQDVQIVSSLVPEDKNSNSITGGRVSFSMMPDIIGQSKETDIPKSKLETVSSLDVENLEMRCNGQKQTHSFRDEMDKFDRLTPLEGLMTSIYDSVDDDTRDIILSKGNTSNAQEQNNSNKTEPNHSPRPTTLASREQHGQINHAFVNDEESNDVTEERSTTVNTAPIIIQDPSDHVINVHPHDTTSQTISTLKISEPVRTPKLNRSLNVHLGDGIGSSVSQDSAVNFATDKNLSTSSPSPDTQRHQTSSNNYTESPLTSPLADPKAVEISGHHFHSPTLPEAHYTARHLVVMETENEENVMSVKHLGESHEMANVATDPEPVLNENGILRNRSTERTQL